MKNKLTKKEVHKKIDDFFSQKNKLNPKYTKKIKRLAMKYNIKLGKYRKKFCKNCFSDLRNGKTRVTKMYKTVECRGCGEKSKWRIR